VKSLDVSAVEVLRAFEVARNALRTDFTRTRAAVVALALAMAIVVCLTTLVERGRAATIRALERAGLGNLYLVNRPLAGSVARERLTFVDADRLRRLTAARSAGAIRMDRRTVTLTGSPRAAPVYGVRGPLSRILGMRAGAGRLLSDVDFERKLPYAVLGSDFARRNPAARPGSIVTVGGTGYEVVGVLAPMETEGAAVGEIPSLDWNRAVIVPLGAEPGAHAEADSRYPIDVAILSFRGAAEAERGARFARSLDSGRFGDGPVRLASPFQTLRQYRQTRGTFDRLLWLVALLTGASAVFGISNLLSASVIARTREIGVRRAVGARSRDIVLQFQLEGILLGLVGGGAGLLIGLAVTLLSVDRSGGAPTISLFSFAALAISCVAIGVLTGIRPSARAARVDPAAALRDG
jgi:ABC-type antimicrobial peptide transport system permease subunit